MSRGVIDQCQTKNYIKNSFLGSFKLVICKQICQDQTDRPLGFLSKVLELLDNKQMGSGIHFSKNIIPVLICGMIYEFIACIKFDAIECVWIRWSIKIKVNML